MKKAILSAFAMSLMVLSHLVWAEADNVDDFLGLENEVLPEIKNELPPKMKSNLQFTTPAIIEHPEWKVTQDKAIIDVPVPNMGQKYSIIPWDTLNPEEWLSIDKWLLERSYKDEAADWKIRLRQEELKELVGKVLQCHGYCEVYRGLNSARVQHLSQVREGDEMRVGKDSVAWIYLMDGSLLRLSPESSISFNEVNLGKDVFFFEARLNEGHVFWSPRVKKEATVDLAPETDSFSLPLLVRGANQAHFERSLYRSQKDADHLKEILDLDENAILQQYKTLNELRNQNNQNFQFSSKMMLVAPNGTLISKNAAFDFVFIPGGKSYFKKRSAEEGDELNLELRGYSESELKLITELGWHELASNGRTFSILTDVPGQIQVMELLTKRIKSIELAREIWIRDSTLPVLKGLKSAELLARDHGYSLWGEELERRQTFLREYTRRIETTNLRAIENLLLKVESSGKTVTRELSDDYYRESLKHYLLGLKSRYDNRKMRVREMTDLQYYIWILKHGKN